MFNNWLHECSCHDFGMIGQLHLCQSRFKRVKRIKRVERVKVKVCHQSQVDKGQGGSNRVKEGQEGSVKVNEGQTGLRSVMNSQGGWRRSKWVQKRVRKGQEGLKGSRRSKGVKGGSQMVIGGHWG